MRSSWIVSSRTLPERISLAVKNRELVYATAIVLLIALISIGVSLQGWKSRIPAFDLLTYIYGVRNFLETGTLPAHGDTGSYGAYKPPGTAWLMLPSTLLFSDPRLSEYTGTALLHILTLVGLFLLARSYFGFRCAVLAILLYGLSEHSYFFAGSLWPNGRPDFYIWVVLFTSLWVMRKQTRYLAVALAVWGIGMHVDMGITPAFFIFPAAWLIYKPPVRFKPLVVAGVLVLIVWSPYLRFEAPRGFADIRSQLFQQHIFSENKRVTWCDPSLPLQHYELISNSVRDGLAQTGATPSHNFTPLNKVLNFWNEMKDKAVSNFQPIVPIPGASFILLLLTLNSLLILSLPGSLKHQTSTATHSPFWREWPGLIAVGMILCGLLLSLFVFVPLFGNEGTRFGPRILFIYKLRKILVLGGMALFAGIWIVNLTGRILTRFGIQIQTSQQAEQRRLLLICLLIPWFLLLILAEPGKPERFWWLWPMQSLFLAAFFTHVLPRFRIPKVFIQAGQIAVVLIVAGNSFLLSRLDSWVKTGWAGQDADEIQVVDYIANQMKAEGRDRAAIGYQTFIYPFMAEYNITNPVYKVGAEFDLLLLYRHGIVNTNQCAEGVAEGDEYRIVETRPKPPDWSPKEYFAVPMDDHFHLKMKVRSYQVYHHS